MVQFDSRFSAVMYGEALLAGVNTKDSKIAKISAALQRETLEQMHIILADPQARAVLRLKLLVKRQPSLTHERATLPQKGRYFAALAHKGKKDTTDLQSSSTFGDALVTRKSRGRPALKADLPNRVQPSRAAPWLAPRPSGRARAAQQF
ncbi:hypothetical protein ABBQ38_004822 [Trebouxia sp. C0009 RCD-2024]